METKFTTISDDPKTFDFTPKADVYTISVDGTYQIKGKAVELKKGDQVQVSELVLISELGG